MDTRFKMFLSYKYTTVFYIFVDIFFLFFREKFFSIVKNQCQDHFKVNIDKVLGHLSRSGSVIDDNVRSLFFGDYMQAEVKAYNEVTDFKALTETMEKCVVVFFLAFTA